MPMDSALRRTLREIRQIAAERRELEALRQRALTLALTLTVTVTVTVTVTLTRLPQLGAGLPRGLRHQPAPGTRRADGGARAEAHLVRVRA